MNMDEFTQSTSFWISLVAGIICIYALFVKIKNLRRTELINRLPGPKPVFLLGNAHQFIAKREDRFAKGTGLIRRFSQYPLMRLWIMSMPTTIAMKAEAIEAVLNSSRLIDKAEDYRYLHPWLGLGLLTSTGTQWRSRRKMLTPSFHFKILEDFLTIFWEQSEILVSILKQFEGKDQFDIYPYFARCTLDIICETAMGKNLKSQHETESKYLEAVNNMGQITSVRTMSPWLNNDWLFSLTPHGRIQKKSLKILHGFTNEVIKERRVTYAKKLKSKGKETEDIFGKKKRLAFLDMLIESSMDGKGLTDEDIREEVDTFMFEGHDTTSCGLTWILYNIGRLPEIQQKLHLEIDHVFGQSDRPINSKDLNELKFLDCVIKESLRMHPPVPLIGRRLLEDIEICGYKLPAGVDINICPYLVHHDPDYFPDPEKFDPDRFLPENCVNRHPYAFIPFSAGPRNCIGQKFAMMEEKTIVSHILRHFRVISMTKIEDLKMLGELVLRPANGMWMQLEKR